jgi:MFS transporter, DHA1 family, inner membrane transport protein
MKFKSGDRTPAALCALLFFGGTVAAAQVGKAVVSLPMMRSEMGLGIDVAGAILSVFATLGATCGIGGGAYVAWIGPRRALIWGMIALAVGNLCGAVAAGTPALLTARAIEGAGFFGVVLATPSLLARVAATADRDLIMALWSAYMPIGIASMLLLGPVLPTIGWQLLWLVNAAVACALAIGLHHALPTRPIASSIPVPPLSSIVVVLRDRRCALMASAFFAYSFHYFSLAFVLPLLLITALGNSLGDAALLGAAGMAVSAVGNLVSGPLLRLGLPAWTAIALTFVAYTVSMVGMFCGGFSTPVVALLAALALGVGGLAPGAIYASAPRVTPTAETLPITIGFFQQASNLGQFVGPLVVGLTIERLGWDRVPIATVPLAALGLGIALAIRRQLATSSRPSSRPASAFACSGTPGRTLQHRTTDSCSPSSGGLPSSSAG